MSNGEPSSKRGWRFLDAADWVDEQFETEAVQSIVMNDTSSKSRFLDAAELVEPLFRERFPNPYAGETDEEFAARRARTKPKRRVNLVQWPPETPERHGERMQRLRQDLTKRFTELAHRGRSKGPSARMPPPVPLPVPKKRRKLTGLDVFQASEEVGDGAVITKGDRTFFDIGSQRRTAGELWDAMSEGERAHYEALADERNAARAEEEPNGGGSEPDAEPSDAYTSNDIARWCATNMDTMRRVFKWGGLLVVGGPDEKGAPRTFIYGVGQNREGESLLDVIQKGTGVNESQLQALDLLWVEQTVEVLQSEDPNHGDSVASRIIAALRRQEERASSYASTATTSRATSVSCPIGPLAPCPTSPITMNAELDMEVPSSASSSNVIAQTSSPTDNAAQTDIRAVQRRATLHTIKTISRVSSGHSFGSGPVDDWGRGHTPPATGSTTGRDFSPAPSQGQSGTALGQCTVSQSVQSLTPNEAVFASETPGQEPCVVVAGGKDVASVLTDIDAGSSPAGEQSNSSNPVTVTSITQGESPGAKRGRGPSTSAANAAAAKRARGTQDRVAGVLMREVNPQTGLVNGREPRTSKPSEKKLAEIENKAEAEAKKKANGAKKAGRGR